MKKEKEPKVTWKRDYGDGEYTEDSVAWYNGNPLDICISGDEDGYVALYLGNRQVQIGDKRKELKEFFNQDAECQAYLREEIKGL